MVRGSRLAGSNRVVLSRVFRKVKVAFVSAGKMYLFSGYYGYYYRSAGFGATTVDG